MLAVKKAKYSFVIGKRKKVRPVHNHPLLVAAQRNENRIRLAFYDMIETVKRQIDVQALAEAFLNKNLADAFRAIDLENRLKRIAIGHGLPPNKRSLRDALRIAFNEGGKVGVERLHSISAQRAVRKAIGDDDEPSIAMAMSFDDVNPKALDFLDRYVMNLITNVTTEQRDMIQDVVLDAFREGIHPYAQAREIRDIVGLTNQQAKAVDNFRNMLESGRFTEALNRELRDKRFDTTIENARDEDIALDQDYIDKVVDRYAERSLDYRANAIARTESLRASNEGQREAWTQAQDQGFLDPDLTRRKLLLGPDPCDYCQQVADMNDEGVALDEEFETPDGPDSPPFHTHCKCVEGLVFLNPTTGALEEE